MTKIKKKNQNGKHKTLTFVKKKNYKWANKK